MALGTFYVELGMIMGTLPVRLKMSGDGRERKEVPIRRCVIVICPLPHVAFLLAAAVRRQPAIAAVVLLLLSAVDHRPKSSASAFNLS
ncbi:hypothetical protein L1887_14562 [Cichorium endivia]|nr:hypothetical protein L1887_14562 [Cichorium endivia]